MPRKRKTNKHLPQRVYFKHGAYYYVDQHKKWHRLGVTVSESMANWAAIVDHPDKPIYTMNQLFDRYMQEIAPLKAKATYKTNLIQIVPLRLWFGEMQPDEVTPVDIYKYLDNRAIKAKVGANREKALLSHIFSMAIRWGVVKDNPCRDVKRIPEKPRSRYIQDDEFLAVRNIAPDRIKLLMDFAYLTGQRIGDILSIKLNDLTEEGIRIIQNKTGSKLLILWSDLLMECVEKTKQLHSSILQCNNLFCNRRSLPLTYDGFSTIWKRIMKRAIEDKLIETHFTFHDLRAKAASDAKDLNHASKLLGHSNSYLTARTYIRNHIRIVPIK